MKVSLIVLATIIGILTYYGSDSIYYEIKKNVRFIIVILLVVSAFVQKKNDNDSETQQADQFTQTIHMADSALKGILTSYDSIRRIQSSLDSQSKLQEKTNASAKELLLKNQQSVLIQNRIYKNIDRLINPLFPADILVSFEVKFGTLYTREIEKEADKLIFVPYDSLKNITFRYGILEIWDVDRTMSGAVIDEYNILSRCQIFITKDPLSTFVSTKPIQEIQGIGFSPGFPINTIYPYKNKLRKLIVNFNNGTIRFETIYIEHNYNGGHSYISNDISFEDLTKCSVLIAPIKSDERKNVISYKDVIFESSLGKRKGCYISFTSANKKQR
jgi:hypothetical protein